MCGIFGAVGDIDWRIVREIGAQAARRGPQAFGLCWHTETGLQVKGEAVRLNPAEHIRNIQTDAIIGNCRLATSGSYKDIANNQPIVLGSLAISHNGNIRSYLQIAEEAGVKLRTGCDSEVICHLIQKCGVEKTLARLENEGPMALIILQNHKITVYRRGQPLFHQRSNGCSYFCSRKFGEAQPVKEGMALTFGGGE